MTTFKILTIFPEIIDGYKKASLVSKAVEAGLLRIDTINIRDFSTNKHHMVDDRPFGGGPGMIMSAEPLAAAIESCKTQDSFVIYMSPSGKSFNQTVAGELSSHPKLIIICGRYEGIDDRIVQKYVDLELSVGDYILAGGEVASLVVMDTLSRLIPGVLGNEESLKRESFVGATPCGCPIVGANHHSPAQANHHSPMLEYPQYTRPRSFQGMDVPEVLLSGNHKEIEKWQHEKSLEKTKKNRPDLLK
jgi:tRNA (guanine37-N1)-methyltransferase